MMDIEEEKETMKPETEMTCTEIMSAIEQQLDGEGLNLWIGMGRQEREEIAIEVQRGKATIDQACDTVRTWAAEEIEKAQSEI